MHCTTAARYAGTVCSTPGTAELVDDDEGQHDCNDGDEQHVDRGPSARPVNT
jgi:hypothetical protein